MMLILEIRCQRDKTSTVPAQWRDPSLWRDQKPREIRIHQRIDENRAHAVVGPAGNYDNLVEHDGYRLMMRQRRYWSIFTTTNAAI
jgi:hypothetical protein